MNILPKKRWHVRTRENIARVRRDEALAAEQTKETERKQHLAEAEARISFMKSQMNKKNNIEDVEIKKPKLEHVNFFEDIERGITLTGTNKEHEQEVKEEKEKYEKQIGYLTYLGQNTNEAECKTSWYNLKPVRESVDDKEEKDTKSKNYLDPVNKYKQFFNLFPCNKKLEKSKPQNEFVKTHVKHKKHKKHSKRKTKLTKHSRSSDRSSLESESSFNWEDEKIIKEQELKILREKRLQRERREKIRAEQLLSELRGERHPDDRLAIQFERQYNTQFNPHLARQNILK